MNTFATCRLAHALYGPGAIDVASLQRLGLLASKIAQWGALRVDCFPKSKCRELAKLYRHATPISSEAACALIKSHAPQLLECLDQVDDTPFATGTVAQVHHARLRRNHAPVVVKLIKRDFAQALHEDVVRLKEFHHTAARCYPPLRRVGNLPGIVDAIERAALAELDLRNELCGHFTLKQLHASGSQLLDLSALAFAPVYTEHCVEKAMVAEFLPGPTLDALIDKRAFDYESVLDLCRIQFYFLFVAGTFHGDLHPGNVILLDNHFYFLDTAYIATAPEAVRRQLFHCLDALSQGDTFRSASHFNQMANTPLYGAIYTTFLKKFHELHRGFHGHCLSEISLTQQLRKTFQLAAECGMQFTDDLADILKSLFYLDGIALRSRSNALLLEDLQPTFTTLRPFVANL